MKSLPLTAKLFLRLLPVLLLAAAIPWYLAYWLNHGWLIAIISAILLLSLMWWSLRRALAPMRALFRALESSVYSYRDGEYNFGIHWPSTDELGALVNAHAQLGDVLRQQRQHLVQRELLLDTMVQNTPVAMLLTSPGGDNIERTIYANLAARQLLNAGKKLEGKRIDLLMQSLPQELHTALANTGDSLFSIQASDDSDEQTYHLARRQFLLNGHPHHLLLIRQLTHELRRQEVHTWKKVIRVISHELNNSLAPIASLAHSGSELIKRQRYDQLPTIFATIEERARHLESFIRGYARFAKLPQPQLQHIHWAEFLNTLQQQIPFQLQMPEPTLQSRIDPTQISQALLNLIKNAIEASTEQTSPTVELHLSRLPQAIRIEILDHGTGMNDAVLQNALVPFYSTKRNGTGLGLALTREIIEAHGGYLSLHNRKQGGLSVTIQLPQ